MPLPIVPVVAGVLGRAGLAKGLGAVGSAVSGIVSAAGDVLGGVLDAIKPDEKAEGGDTTIIVNGESGNKKKGYAGGSSKPPKIKQATRVAINDNMSADQLLKVAVNYLSAIDENMKNRMIYDDQMRRLDLAAQREIAVEESGTKSMPLGLNKAPKKTDDGESSPGIGSMVLRFGGIATALALVAKELGFLDFDWPSLDQLIFGRSEDPRTPDGTSIDDAINSGLDWVGSEGLREAVNRALPSTRRNDSPAPSGGTQQNNAPNSAYDIVYGNGIYGSPESESNKNLTDMTIGEVLQFQTTLLRNTREQTGTPHSPVGAYQMTKATIEDVAPNVLGDNWRSQRFDRETQDRLAEARFNQISDLSRLNEVWAAMPNADYTGRSFADLKDEIVQREVGTYAGMAPAEPSQAATAEPQSEENILTRLMDIMKETNPDPSATYRPDITSAEPDYNRYTDLYYKNIEMENNTIAGMRAERTSNGESAGAQITATQSAFAEANDGSLDVINPNYRLKDNEIISDYLGNFGYR